MTTPTPLSNEGMAWHCAPNAPFYVRDNIVKALTAKDTIIAEKEAQNKALKADIETIKEINEENYALWNQATAQIEVMRKALKHFLEIECVREKCSDCDEPYDVEDFHSHSIGCEVGKAEEALATLKVDGQ
jgi:hypothetical protein